MLTSNPVTSKVLNEEEQRVLAHYLVREFYMETPKEWRAQEKSWLQKLLNLRPNDFKKYVFDQVELFKWLANNPQIAKQILLHDANNHKIHQSETGLETELYKQPYQHVSQEFTELLEKVEYNKTLFRFIIGKLTDRPAVRDIILQEIAILVVQHSFDPNNGGVLPINEMLWFVSDLKRESLLHDNNGDLTESDPFLVTPTLIHLRSTMKFSNVENLEPDAPCALKILGTEASIPEFIGKVIRDIRHLRNIHIVELERIDQLDQDQDLSRIYQEFTTVLYQSSHIVSIELNNLHPKMIGILTQNLPLSVQRFSVGVQEDALSHPRETFTFPPEVHLVCLQLHNCLSRMGDLFRNTAFPNVKKLSIKNDCYEWEGKESLVWKKEDAQSLLDAVRTGRMSELEMLNIRDSCLKGCGPELVEILKAESFCSAQFVGAELSIEDGEIFLENIQDGNLDHVEELNFIENDEISLLKEDFETACEQREIILEMNSSSSDIDLFKYIKELAGKDVALAVARLQLSFTTEQVQTVKSLISSLTTEQTRSTMTLFFSLTPKQKQTVKTLLSSFTAEHAQTFFTNIFQNKSRAQLESPENIEVNTVPGDTGNEVASPLTTLVYSVIKEQIEDAAVVMARIVSSLNPEQTLNMMTLLSSLNPEQVRSMKTLISSLTQEQKQTMMTLILSFTPEQTDIVMTTFTKDTENQSSSGEQQENPTNATPQSQGASIGPGTDNSTSQDHMGFDVAQTMAAFVSNFYENRSSFAVQSGTPSREVTNPQFDFSSIGVPTFCTLDNSANQDEKQSTATVQPESPSREAPQSQFDFSSIRNLVHTFFDANNKVKQDEPQESTENSPRRSEAPQSQFGLSSVRNLVHTFFNTNNSMNQDEPQDTKEDSQQRKDCRDDLDLD